MGHRRDRKSLYECVMLLSLMLRVQPMRYAIITRGPDMAAITTRSRKGIESTPPDTKYILPHNDHLSSHC